MSAMRAAALVVALCGCGFTPQGAGDAAIGGSGDGGGPRDAPADTTTTSNWLTGYHYRKPITVTAAAALVDFPLGVLRIKDHDLAAHANGDDLVITGADGVTPLDRELVTSLVDGTIELWVRVTLAPGAQTLYLYYGGVSGADSHSMWSGMTGVWHLSDPMMTAVDSSPHAHTLAAAGPMQTPMSKPGVAGNARSYDGMDDSYGIADPGDGSLDVGMSSFSFTLWVKSNAVGMFDTPLWKGGTSTAEPGYCLITGTQFWNVKIHDGTTYVDPLVGNASQLANQWVHVAGVVDRTAHTFTAYANGALAQALPITGVGSLDNNLGFAIGRPTNGAFKGLVDEVRIYPRALPPEWIAAEYANLATPSFEAFGAEEMH
jgi:hypothetical protein